MSDHVGERYRRILVGGMTVAGESYRRDTRCVHDTLHTVLACRVQNRTRTFHIRAIHLCRIAHPEPVVGGDVK